MVQNDKSVHLGDGVTDKVKENLNENISEVLMLLSNIVFSYIKDKAKDIPNAIEELLSSQEVKQEIVDNWSNQLFEQGIIPKSYIGLSDDLLISNFRQEGYLDGLYTGYVIAMMALVDNDASKELIIAVRDNIQPKLLRNSYVKRDAFYKSYEDIKYNWIETTKRT